MGLKGLGGYIEPQLQKHNEELNLTVNNNNVPENGMTYGTMEEARGNGGRKFQDPSKAR